MATKTTNYHLIKPGMSDAADIDVLNKNMDTIDSLIKSMELKEEIELGSKSVSVTAFTEQPAISHGFIWRAAIELEGVLATDVINLYAEDETSDLGILSQKTDSYDGGVYIYCRLKPTQALSFFRITKKRSG